ncbi:MAG TPA: hypothetical protein VM925_08655 [Labilithrix sp.]|nr:hypothetical protein [Labilithrix sp.]
MARMRQMARAWVLVSSLLLLGVAPGCAPETPAEVGATESDLSRTGTGIAARARTLFETKNGITVDEALKRATVAATNSAALKEDAVDVDYLVERLGAGALPFVLERPWRREHVVARAPLTEAQAIKMVRLFAERGAADVVGPLLDTLISNPSLSDSFKRQLVATTITASEVDAKGYCRVDPTLVTKISVAELTQMFLGDHRSWVRGSLASLLSSRAFGFDTLPSAARRAAIDALLADRAVDVRIAAASLFWEGSKVTRDSQAGFVGILDAPDTVAQARLDAIFASGWSRERADMLGMPDRAVDGLLDLRAVMLGTLLEGAPKNADLSYLLDETAKYPDFQGVASEAARRVLESTQLTDAEKAVRLETLTSAWEDWKVVMSVVARFAWQHPELAPSMPKALDSLAGWRYDDVEPADLDAWRVQLSTPGGLRQGFREALAAHGSLVFADALVGSEAPLVRQTLQGEVSRVANGERLEWKTFSELVAKAVEVGVPATSLLPYPTKLFDPNGFVPYQREALIAYAMILKDPSIDRITLLGVLDKAVPFILQNPGDLGGVAFEPLVALLHDPRLTATDRDGILAKSFPNASVYGARQAAELLVRLGTPAKRIADLTKNRPEMFLDIAPLPLDADAFSPLPSRANVLAAHLGGPAIDEPTVRTKLEAELELGVDAWWTREITWRRWNATPRPRPTTAAIRAGTVGVGGQETLRLYASAPDLASTSDADVEEFFNYMGGHTEIVEPYWLMADVARGKSYDAVKAAHRATAPLAWDEADKATTEADKLEIVLTRSPSGSPLWDGALLGASARCPRVSDDFRRSRILGAMTSGYLMNTSADTNWDAFDAVEGYSGPSTDFIAPRLLRFGERFRVMADSRNALAMEPLLIDARLPEDIVRDALLATIDATLKAEFYLDHHPAGAVGALVMRTLDARSDLSPKTRDLLVRGIDLLLETAKLTIPERRMRHAIERWRTVDRATATFQAAGPPWLGPRQTETRNVDGVDLEIVLLFGQDVGAGATSYWIHDPKKGWSGAFALPELGPLDPER